MIVLYSLYWLYKRRIRPPVNKNDIVLEIGSGDKPHWRSDVLVDKYLYDNLQRSSGNIFVDENKIFIIGDIEHLPFKDKEFDYVITSHVLEHIDNLDSAIKEISRVGKAGYIEVPYGFLDIIRPFATHLWICDVRNNRLIFKRKSKYSDQLLLKFGDIFFKYFSNRMMNNLDKFFVMYEWKENIKYDILDIDEKDKYFYGKNMSRSEERNQTQLKSLISRFLYRFMYRFMVVCLYKRPIFKKKNRSKYIINGTMKNNEKKEV